MKFGKVNSIKEIFKNSRIRRNDSGDDNICTQEKLFSSDVLPFEESYKLSKWSGVSTFESVSYKVANSCTVDAWLILFANFPNLSNAVYKQYGTISEVFLSLLNLCVTGCFSKAKVHLAGMIGVNAVSRMNQNIIDLWGNEEEIWNHSFGFMLSRSNSTLCNSINCPQPCALICKATILVFQKPEVLIAETVANSLMDWFTGSRRKTNCKRRFTGDVPVGADVIFDIPILL